MQHGRTSSTKKVDPMEMAPPHQESFGPMHTLLEHAWDVLGTSVDEWSGQYLQRQCLWQKFPGQGLGFPAGICTKSASDTSWWSQNWWWRGRCHFSPIHWRSMCWLWRHLGMQNFLDEWFCNLCGSRFCARSSWVRRIQSPLWGNHMVAHHLSPPNPCSCKQSIRSEEVVEQEEDSSPWHSSWQQVFSC